MCTDNMGLGEEDGRLLLLPAAAVLQSRIDFQGDSEFSRLAIQWTATHATGEL